MLLLPALASAAVGLRVAKRQMLFWATVYTGGHGGTGASLYFPKWLLSITSFEQHNLLNQKEKADTMIFLSEMRKTRSQETYKARAKDWWLHGKANSFDASSDSPLCSQLASKEESTSLGLTWCLGLTLGSEHKSLALSPVQVWRDSSGHNPSVQRPYTGYHTLVWTENFWVKYWASGHSRQSKARNLLFRCHGGVWFDDAHNPFQLLRTPLES